MVTRGIHTAIEQSHRLALALCGHYLARVSRSVRAIDGQSDRPLPQCRTLLCQAAKAGIKLTYEDLAAGLGVQSPRQQWSTVLGPIADDEVKKTGYDLTLVVVYKSGPAKGLSRYFSNIRGGQAPQSTVLDPKDAQQVAAYNRDLAAVFAAYANAVC